MCCTTFQPEITTFLQGCGVGPQLFLVEIYIRGEVSHISREKMKVAGLTMNYRSDRVRSCIVRTFPPRMHAVSAVVTCRKLFLMETAALEYVFAGVYAPVSHKKNVKSIFPLLRKCYILVRVGKIEK